MIPISGDFFALDRTMLILSDLYRVAINTGERVLSPGMKKVLPIPFISSSHRSVCPFLLAGQMVSKSRGKSFCCSSRLLCVSRDHPAGMKYIHFWAPLMKWSLVGAGFGDMLRPANKLSLNQSISLFATGTIWSRYAMVIIPKNYMLFAVNVFLAFVGAQQLARIAHYRYTNPETNTKGSN